jgi:hypothetical protein
LIWTAEALVSEGRSLIKVGFTNSSSISII